MDPGALGPTAPGCWGIPGVLVACLYQRTLLLAAHQWGALAIVAGLWLLGLWIGWGARFITRGK